MTTVEFKARFGMAFFAIACVLLWLFTVGDPCLDTAISNHWPEKALAKSASAAAIAHEDGQVVVVDGPYGRATCHYWPTTTEKVVSASSFVAVLFGIGWLTARRVPHRPILTAAGVTVLALTIAVVLQVWARFAVPDFAQLRWGLLVPLIGCAVGAGIAMLGAWLSGKFIRRA